MHRKKADFDPSGAKTPEPILMKLGMVDYVRDPTPHANFGGVALRGWSGHVCDLLNLGVSFLSFLFCFFLFFAFFATRTGRIS